MPVILDWDKRSPLPDGVRIFNPNADHPLWGGIGTGDCEVLAALIAQASLFIGVDSGPLHVAGASIQNPKSKIQNPPVLAVWTGHHPLHYFGLAEHVTHLVPSGHATRLRGDAASGLTFFKRHYRHCAYQQLDRELPVMVAATLPRLDARPARHAQHSNPLRSSAFDDNYYLEHKLAGLDYLGFGDWQRQYGRWLVESFGWQGQRLLDVGCACGAILRGLREAGAVAEGVDVSEAMVRRGREKWADLAGLLHVCDAVNLHLFEPGAFDAIHTAQVAEHWKPELVPHILRELARITIPGGLLFCALDTTELFARQGRTMERRSDARLHSAHELVARATCVGRLATLHR